VAQSRRNRARIRWVAAALLALALHAALIAALSSSGALRLFRKEAAAPARVNPVSLRTVPKSAWAEHRKVQSGAAPAEKPRAAPPPAVERPPPAAAGRVVDVAPGNGQAPNDEAKFLAESNNRVEKETVSRHRALDYKTARPQPTAPVRPNPAPAESAAPRQAALGNGGEGHEDAPAREARKRAVPEAPSAEQPQALALRLDGFDGSYPAWLQRALRAGRPEPRGAAGESGRAETPGSEGRKGPSDLLSLAPSSAVLDRIVGAPASDLSARDGVEEGEATFLNTREWKYASFFNRVKRDVGSQWHPISAIREADPTGAGLARDRSTVLSVTLDASGRIEALHIVQSSGFGSLDREAMAAFERAQPFQNPPPGLLNERGDLAFNFGFYIEADRAGLRLFRPPAR
jgi:TonB family protein